MSSSIPPKPLSPRKLRLLLDARGRGETIDEAAVRKYAKAVSPGRIAAYLEAALSGDAVVPPPPPPVVSSPRSFVLADESGIEIELEVVRETAGTVVLRKFSERLVTVMVKGRATRVDLHRLRRMRTEEFLEGVRAPLLLAAAEIASPQ